MIVDVLQKNPVGSKIFQIEATDEDHGRNSKVTYEIQQENDWEMFAIDPDNGILSNKVILDREKRQTYEVFTHIL